MVKFVKVKRNINFGENPGERYVARIYRGNDVDLETLANDIANATTISYPDVIACLKALEMTVSKYVQNGQAVKLDYLGSFIPAIQAKTQESADEVDASTIKRFWCRFFPTVEFKRELSKSKFAMADLEVKNLIK